jgi:hypothetical protein
MAVRSLLTKRKKEVCSTHFNLALSTSKCIHTSTRIAHANQSVLYMLIQLVGVQSVLVRTAMYSVCVNTMHREAQQLYLCVATTTSV